MDSSSVTNALAPPRSHLRRPISPSRRSSERPRSTAAIDSLLTDISPSFILDVLLSVPAATQHLPNDYSGTKECHDFIRSTIAKASSSEKTWGIRASEFASRIKELLDEASSWTWPAGSSEQESGFLTGGEELLTQDLDRRADEIQNELARLDDEELKRYVRGAHVHIDGYHPAINAGGNGYEVMGDFSTLITATIVQALPRLARLKTLLNIWSLRILVLREAFGFQEEMDTCNGAMKAAFGALESRKTPLAASGSPFSESEYERTKRSLQDQVSRLAQQLDSMLDLLEGSQDTLPDLWVDNMERLENDYGVWVVNAQQLVLSHELERTTYDAQADTSLGGDKVGPEEVELNQREISSKMGEQSDQPELDAGDLYQGQLNDEPDPGHKRREPIQEILPDLTFAMQDQEGSKIAGFQSMNDAGVASPNSDSVRSSSSTPIISDLSSAESSPLIAHAKLATNLGSPKIVTSPSAQRQFFDFPTQPDGQEIHGQSTLISSRQSWHGLISDVNQVPEQNKRWSSLDNRAANIDVPEQERRAIIQGAPDLSRQGSASLPSGEKAASQSIRASEHAPSDGHPPLANLKEDSEGPRGVGSTEHRASLQESPRLSADKSQLSSRPTTPTFVEDGQVPKSNTEPNPTVESPQAKATGNIPNSQSQEPFTKPPAQKRAVTLGNLMRLSNGTKKSSKTDTRLHQQINSILSNIPADIQFQLANDANDSGPQTSLKTPPRRLSMPRVIRSRTSTPTPSTSLAPAMQVEPKGRPDSDVRLYHLYQAGREAPIKLHVRLVGEGSERVMVRVGGGWADLREYLTEYAVHHGKRTTSGNKFNIQNLPAQTASSPAVESPASPNNQHNENLADADPLASSRPMKHPHNLSSPPQTPPSALESSDIDSPSPVMGLAGPRAREVEISPRKRAWVEGMLRQARNTSGGDAAQDNVRKSSGQMGGPGRVGGVRRVFLRGRKDSQ